jgi:hypothetical protein
MPTFRVYFGAYNPYDSDSDSESGFTCEVPDLTTENYLQWSFRAQNALEFSRNNLWPIVSGAESAPESGDIAAFKLRQLQALNVIRQCIPPAMQLYYGVNTESGADPKVVWDTIRDTYRKSLHPWTIRRELYSARLENFNSVSAYTIHIDWLVFKYNFAVGKAPERTITKEEHTSLYLHGLSESWNTVMMAWQSGDDSDVLLRDPEKLMCAMRRYEAQAQWLRDWDVKCFKCKQKGHRKRDCPS